MKNKGQIKAILFDLDGTLLPMDQDNFVKAYMGALALALAPKGYEGKELISAIWRGMYAMIKNNGDALNYERFWSELEKIYGSGVRAEEQSLNEFYENDFDRVSASCGYSDKSRQVIELCKSLGYRVVLATNPVFPEIATRKRIGWAGLSFDDFELVTHYSNSRYCKPNLDYYKEILDKIGLCAHECVMVGNDVGEDMVARELGMRVFLLENHIINKNGEDISVYPHGDYEDLVKFLGELK